MKRTLVVTTAALLVTLIGCSSSTSSTASCDLSDKAKVTAVTKTGGDPGCPDLTVAQLNSSSDGGSDSNCQPKVDSKACTATIACTTADQDGSTTTVSGNFAKSGSEYNGEITVNTTPAQGDAMSCKYKMTIK